MLVLKTPWKVKLNIACGGLYDVYDAEFNLVAEAKIIEVARLIAAAPELLAACETVLDWMDCDWLREDKLEAQRILRNAVEKARGTGGEHGKKQD